MNKAVAVLLAYFLFTAPASAVVIVAGTDSGSYDTSLGSGSIPYSLQGSGNALVVGTYLDAGWTGANPQFGGVAADGFIQQDRALLAYFFNPAASGNFTLDTGAAATNSAYFIYELSYVDTTAGADLGMGSTIDTTVDNRLITNFIGANNTNGAELAPAIGSIAILSGVGDANGAAGGGSIGAAIANEGAVGIAGTKTLGWTGFGGGFGQGEVSAAFSAAPGSPTPWNVNGGGSWNTGTNWVGGNVPSDNPLFGNAHATATTANITLDSPVSVSGMTISNANRYNITGSSTLTLTGGAEILVGEGTHEISTPIAGSAGLTKSGGGNLVLSANNTYTGTTTVQGGALQLANPSSVPGTVDIAAAGQLAFVAGYNGTFNNGISGAGSVALDTSLTTETVTFGGAKTYSGTTEVLGGTLAISNSGALGTGDSTPETGTTVSANGSQGNAKLALSGGVNVANELLTLFPRRGEGVVDLVHVTSAGNNTWGGNIKGDVNGDNYNFESTSGTLTLGGTLSAPDGDGGVRNFVFDGAGNFTIANKITDFETNANGEQTVGSLDTEANVFVYKRGTGKLTIGTATSNPDDFWRGGTVVEGGTLEVLASGTAGELWGPLELRSGTTFDIDAFSTYALSPEVAVSGGGTIQANTLKVFADNSLSPGDGVGTLTINGNAQLSDEFSTAGGVLTFELGDDPTTVGGTENDLIDVNGTLTTIGSPDMTVRLIAAEGNVSAGQYRLISHNGGTVDVSGMTAQFNDALGNPLTIRQSLAITSASGQVNLDVTGSSKNLVWTGANGTAWDKNSTANWADGGAEVFFDQDQVTFNDTVAAPVQGDFNGDRIVNIADYTVWRNNLGGSFDLNGNGDETGGSAGVVDMADYELWKANFGQASAGVTIDISGEDVYPSVANFDSSTGNRFIITGTNGFGGETPIILTGDVTLALQNPNTLQGVVTLGADTTLELGGGSTVEGDITGSGLLNINGGATLNSALSLTGPIEINSQVFPANSGALGSTASGTTINAGGNLWYNFQNLSVAEPMTLNGGVVNVAGNADSALTLTGAITVNAAGGTFRVNPDLGDDGLTISSNIGGTAGGTLTADVSPGSLMTVTGNITNNGTLAKTGTGTLVVGASTSITSPRIAVNGGMLDVSAQAALPVGSGQTLSGRFGTVTGNVSAANGSTIRVGADGLVSGTIYTYTDATWGAEDSNTVVASDGSTLIPLDNIFGTQAQWNDRNFSNGGTVLQGQLGTNADQAPTLKTTLTGLTPGVEYDIQVNIWTDGGGWQVLAGDAANNLTQYVAGGEGTVDTNGQTYDSLVLTAEGNRTMWGVPLTLTANASGEIEVFIDENSANNAARTWYDGVSVANETVVGEMFTIDGDLTLAAGSTLAIDMGTPVATDLLSITGSLLAGGTLEVSLDPTVPAPASGDVFNILDFASASGSFDTLDLPALTAGLTWDTSNLLTTGELSVVGGALSAANVPEPSSTVLLLLATAGLGFGYRHRTRINK